MNISVFALVVQRLKKKYLKEYSLALFALIHKVKTFSVSHVIFFIKNLKKFYWNLNKKKWNCPCFTWALISSLLVADCSSNKFILLSHFHSLRFHFSIKSSNHNGAFYCLWVTSCCSTCCLSTWLKAMRNTSASQSLGDDEWALLVSGVCAPLPPPFSELIINQIDWTWAERKAIASLMIISSIKEFTE